MKKLMKIFLTVGTANYYTVCSKWPKVENSYKPRLKTILKQHHFNVHKAHMNKYSCTQILISLYMDRFAYMQNMRICELKFALDLNQVQISTICVWYKFCIRVQIRSHGQICTREYIYIYANICTRMLICPCECTLRSDTNEPVFTKVQRKNHFRSGGLH